ncbi:hypothetical protein INT43_007426 [Umbelopsis isabellina]|uniref:Methylthioribose-1-phosphate isomerase n=1 Tax=Mortierella isabellina TaxID=91625 RepID=A0A8H7UGT1_MORIS|nr:hypothetical protein INT43_007426 [Umbelopsis isabellina]
MAQTLEAIKYSNGELYVLDQLQLPHLTHFDKVTTIQDGHAAIKEMKTRGAPAIAIVAALSLAVDLQNRYNLGEFDSTSSAVEFVRQSLEYLKTSRPTAVNLFDAAKKLWLIVEERAKIASSSLDIVDTYVKAAETMLEEDVKDNKNIGAHGAKFILENSKSSKVSVLTHCNTGSLATAGWGTALGIIRDLNQSGSLKHAYCTETRPYNQGSRLTAYELVYEKIPSTLVCDSMVSALLRQNPDITAIVVGADRVAANGDTANKIGTYQLAITAKYHGVHFIVAAPSTSIDLTTKCGADIVIEERPAKEVVQVTGAIVGAQVTSDSVPRETVQVAAHGINVWNPSFDVTPANLISCVVTEKGAIVKKGSDEEFDIASFLSA